MARAKKVQAGHCRSHTDSSASLLGENIGREHLEGKRKHEEEEDQLCDFPVDHPLHGECLYTQTFSQSTQKHSCYVTVMYMAILSSRYHKYFYC